MNKFIIAVFLLTLKTVTAQDEEITWTREYIDSLGGSGGMKDCLDDHGKTSDFVLKSETSDDKHASIITIAIRAGMSCIFDTNSPFKIEYDAEDKHTSEI